jgi:hypothetical protein
MERVRDEALRRLEVHRRPGAVVHRDEVGQSRGERQSQAVRPVRQFRPDLHNRPA